MDNKWDSTDTLILLALINGIILISIFLRVFNIY